MARELTPVDDDYAAGHRAIAWYDAGSDAGDFDAPERHYVAYGATKEQALERLEKQR
jgi:hypothetical protein